MNMEIKKYKKPESEIVIIQTSCKILEVDISTDPTPSSVQGAAKSDIPMQEDNKPISEKDTPLSYSPWED
ncbi:MAG: hypothetical protein ACI4A7_00470 [Prevotella sp.]